MSLSDAAARVMGMAQQGKVGDALALADGLLDGSRTAPVSDQAALWYAVGVAEHVRADHAGAHTAADHCVRLATEAGSPGWASNGLALRALALARQGRVEAALLDLARSELRLTECDDRALRCWAHTGLGGTYLELRLYELAQPHLVRAQELDASPIPLVQAPVIDLMNLAELHIRWADELEQVRPEEARGFTDLHLDRGDGVAAHRTAAHDYAVRAVEVVRGSGDPGLLATCRAMELCTRPRSAAVHALAELREEFAGSDHLEHQGGRAAVGGALARALWNLGRRDEALEVAEQAALLAEAVTDWQAAASAQWLLVEMQALAGIPGAVAGQAYATLLARVLWQQRLSTLQGARAALEVEGLHRDKLAAQRAAAEDPLTGVSNRRVLDEALRDAEAEAQRLEDASLPADPTPMSLLMVDLNDFKIINDTYGHVVGDEVLQVVAMALRGVARADDVVARLGGDEFVVLARGADESAAEALAGRLTDAVDALGVGTRDGVIGLSASVGVATTRNPAEVAELLAEADEAMYAVKRRRWDRD